MKRQVNTDELLDMVVGLVNDGSLYEKEALKLNAAIGELTLLRERLVALEAAAREAVDTWECRKDSFRFQELMYALGALCVRP